MKANFVTLCAALSFAAAGPADDFAAGVSGVQPLITNVENSLKQWDADSDPTGTDAIQVAWNTLDYGFGSLQVAASDLGVLSDADAHHVIQEDFPTLVSSLQGLISDLVDRASDFYIVNAEASIKIDLGNLVGYVQIIASKGVSAISSDEAAAPLLSSASSIVSSLSTMFLSASSVYGNSPGSWPVVGSATILS